MSSPLRKISSDELSSVIAKALNEHFKYDGSKNQYGIKCYVNGLNYKPYSDDEEAECSLTFTVEHVFPYKG